MAEITELKNNKGSHKWQAWSSWVSSKNGEGLFKQFSTKKEAVEWLEKNIHIIGDGEDAGINRHWDEDNYETPVYLERIGNNVHNIGSDRPSPKWTRLYKGGNQ